MCVVFPCRHCFHFDCVGEYRCLLCRNELKYCMGEGNRVLSFKTDERSSDKNRTATDRLRQFDEALADMDKALQQAS